MKKQEQGYLEAYRQMANSLMRSNYWNGFSNGFTCALMMVLIIQYFLR